MTLARWVLEGGSNGPLRSHIPQKYRSWEDPSAVATAANGNANPNFNGSRRLNTSGRLTYSPRSPSPSSADNCPDNFNPKKSDRGGGGRPQSNASVYVNRGYVMFFV